MKHALFVPNFGAFAEPQAFADLAGQAEAAGWDGLYIWDHILIEDGTPMCDPWVAMAAAATLTTKIRLGPMVTPTPRRHPWKLAREVVSLDRLSQGRVDFGVGIGHPPEIEYGSFGHETDNRIRADKLDESLELITGSRRADLPASPFSAAAGADLGGGHLAEQATVPTSSPVGWSVPAQSRTDRVC